MFRHLLERAGFLYDLFLGRRLADLIDGLLGAYRIHYRVGLDRQERQLLACQITGLRQPVFTLPDTDCLACPRTKIAVGLAKLIAQRFHAQLQIDASVAVEPDGVFSQLGARRPLHLIGDTDCGAHGRARIGFCFVRIERRDLLAVGLQVVQLIDVELCHRGETAGRELFEIGLIEGNSILL